MDEESGRLQFMGLQRVGHNVGFPVAQASKEYTCNAVRSLCWEDPLEKGKATHSSILACRIPWTIQSMGSQRVGHDWETFTFHYGTKQEQHADYRDKNVSEKSLLIIKHPGVGRILKMLKSCLCIFFINLYTKFYDYIRIILFTSDMSVIYFDYFNFLSTFEFVKFFFLLNLLNYYFITTFSHSFS